MAQCHRWVATLLTAVILGVAAPSSGYSARSLPEPLAAPTGPVILTIEGSIAVTNVGETAQFDRAQLIALGIHTLTSSNLFEPGIHTFDGVLLSDVLDRVGATGHMLTAKAIDGYEIDLPMADPETYPVILAHTWNGAVMRVRNKGPLWIIYPIDAFPELKVEKYSTRSVWQLTTLRVH